MELTEICKKDLKKVKVNGKEITQLVREYKPILAQKGYITVDDINKSEGMDYKSRANWGRCVFSQCVHRT